MAAMGKRANFPEIKLQNVGCCCKTYTLLKKKRKRKGENLAAEFELTDIRLWQHKETASQL